MANLYGIKVQKEVERILALGLKYEAAARKEKASRWKYFSTRTDPLLIPLDKRLAAYKKQKLLLTRSERASATREKNKASAVWSADKQRRSRVDWNELVPPGVAAQQTAYERRATVLAMCDAGVSLKEIGRLFGVTGSRIAGMRDQHKRELKYYRTPPVARYIARHGEDLFNADVSDAELCRLSIAARDIANAKRRDWLYV
jgi:hypothetical protein